MKIHVTQEDIQNGVAQSPWECPVALAIIRELGESRVNVLNPIGNMKLAAARINGIMVDLPESVARFIAEFDAGHAEVLSPFEFDLV